MTTDPLTLAIVASVGTIGVGGTAALAWYVASAAWACAAKRLRRRRLWRRAGKRYGVKRAWLKSNHRISAEIANVLEGRR